MPRLIQFDLTPDAFAQLVAMLENKGELTMNDYRLTHQHGARRIGSITSGNRESLQRVADSLNKRFPTRKYKVERIEKPLIRLKAQNEPPKVA